MSESHGHAHAPADAHGHGGLAKYIVVFVMLCFLTGASFFTYSEYWPFHETPAIGWFFMMAVSCTKASLVILFFMHLKYEADWKYVLTIPASIMSLFLVLALVPDIGMRVHGMFKLPDNFYGYSEERLEHVGTRADAQKIENASAAQHAAEHGSDGAKSHGH